MRATLVPTDRPIEIGHSRMLEFGDSRSSQSWRDGPLPPVATAASLDEIAEPDVPLLQTARLLADQMGQVFGVAEMKQINSVGEIQLRYWKGAGQEPDRRVGRTELATEVDGGLIRMPPALTRAYGPR